MHMAYGMCVYEGYVWIDRKIVISMNSICGSATFRNSSRNSDW